MGVNKILFNVNLRVEVAWVPIRYCLVSTCVRGEGGLGVKKILFSVNLGVGGGWRGCQ